MYTGVIGSSRSELKTGISCSPQYYWAQAWELEILAVSGSSKLYEVNKRFLVLNSTERAILVLFYCIYLP